MVTWKLLLTVPELAGLVPDAQSIAANERRPWYRDWLPTSVIFADACRSAAWRLGVDPIEVRQTALLELLRVYDRAKAGIIDEPALTPPKRRTWGKRPAAEEPFHRLGWDEDQDEADDRPARDWSKSRRPS